MKKVKVNFVRHFTSGTLKGLDHPDTITFACKQNALGWVNGIEANKRVLDYVIKSYEILPVK